MKTILLSALLLTLSQCSPAFAQAVGDLIIQQVTATGADELYVTPTATRLFGIDSSGNPTTVSLANGLSMPSNVLTIGTKDNWLLTLPIPDEDTISTEQVGMGWADGRFTLQTPVGAFQLYETGSPLEPTLYWPGRLQIDTIEANLVTANFNGNQITSGTIPSLVMLTSTSKPMRQWQDNSAYAGANGLTYSNTGPSGINEPATPGRYYPVIDVVDDNSTGNYLDGEIRTAAQLRADLDLEVGTDLQAYNANTTVLGSSIDLAAEVTGTLPIANGGTGQTTAGAAINALLPSQSGNSGKYLTTDGTNPSWGTVTAGLGGSTGSTDNALLRADGTGGATMQSSMVTVSDSGGVNAAGFYVVSNTYGMDYSTGWGMGWKSNGDTVAVANSNVGQNQIVLASGGGIGFNGSTPWYPDTTLFRTSEGRMALRNQTGYIGSTIYTSKPQAFEVYNTYTSSTNYERFVIDWQDTTNVVRIGTQVGGTGGTARDIQIVTDNVTRITVKASGAILFSGLPGTDPGVSGQLWNDSGTLKVSP